MKKAWTRVVTSWLILSTIVIWIVWDIYVATNSIPGDTESEVIRDWAWRYPSFAFAIGVLNGHWFWTVTEKRSLWMMYALWVMGAGLIVMDVYFRLIPMVVPIVPLIIGVVMGHFMWPLQHAKELRRDSPDLSGQ